MYTYGIFKAYNFLYRYPGKDTNVTHIWPFASCNLCSNTKYVKCRHKLLVNLYHLFRSLMLWTEMGSWEAISRRSRKKQSNRSNKVSEIEEKIGISFLI